jgi:hypothetical protein
MSVLIPQSRARAVADDVQANLVRTSKFADGKTRNWTMFFFFRILARAESEAPRDR